MTINKPMMGTAAIIYLSFGCAMMLNAEQISLTEKCRIGVEDRKEELFFKIIDAKADTNGNIFILDSHNNCIRKFSKSLKFMSEAGKQGQGPGDMNSPMGIAIDQSGNVYVNDYGNMRINVYNNNLGYFNTIKLQPSISIEGLYINAKGDFIIFRSPRIKGDSYFSLFSNQGEYLRSFFSELHPLAPILTSMKEIRVHMTSLAFLSGKANLNQTRTKIGFTYEIPQNPCLIYLMDADGNVTKKISRSIKGYDPKKQQQVFEAILKNKTRIHGIHALIIIRSLHFTKEGYLIVQRRDEIYKNGSFDGFRITLDCLSPEGNLIWEEREFNGEILSIDDKNNVLTCIEDPQGISQLTIYSLIIKK